MNRTCLKTMPVVACALFLLDTQNASALQLVKQGQPRASIVVAKNASPQVLRAAQILQDYVRKCSGATLPITSQAKGAAIHVGPTFAIKGLDRKKIDADGFVLRGIDKNNYAIVGGSDWGAEFGVNDFLERYLGVRWLFPGELGTDIPRHRTIDIPDTVVAQNPSFISRQISPASTITKADDEARWARANRAKPRIKFHHNLLHLFPFHKYGKTHPEFYPILNGKRHIPTDAIDESWQPNLSAPGIVEAAAAEIEEYFRKNPNETSYSLGMNDSNAFDESPASKARRNGKKNYLGDEDVSDDYFAWANAVVTRVLKKYPDKWFGTLAYHAIAEPPSRVKVHPRIVPFLTYDRMRWEDPARRAHNMQLTRRWAKVSPLVGWYDYAYGISYQLPRVYPHTMQKYLSWGAANQVKFSYAEIYPNWGEGPKPYVFTRLLWNPNQNVDALLDDWYIHCGGVKAAPELRKYYEVWERFWTVDIHKTAWSQNSKGEYLPFGSDPTYLLAVPQSYITRSDAALNAALKLADTPQRKARVAKLAQMWDFYKVSIQAYQGANFLTKNPPRSEGEALASLERTERVMQLARKRRNLIGSFSRDPLFKLTAGYMDDYSGTDGKTWGESLISTLIPWMQKSEQVRVRVRQMSSKPGSSFGEVAAFIIGMAEGDYVPVTANQSFEDGSDSWVIWDKASEGPAFPKGEWLPSSQNAYSGTKSFLVRGLGRGGLIQELPYQPGKYYALARAFVPKSVRPGEATLRLQVLNAKGEVMEGAMALPSSDLSLRSGAWAMAAVPFTLPANSGGEAKSFRLLLLLNDFTPAREIYLDDVGIYKPKEE